MTFFVIFQKFGNTIAGGSCNLKVLRVTHIFLDILSSEWPLTQLNRMLNIISGACLISNILKSFAKTCYFQNLVMLPQYKSFEEFGDLIVST